MINTQDIKPGRYIRYKNSTKLNVVQNVGDRAYILNNTKLEDIICCEADPRQCVQEGDLAMILYTGNDSYSLQEVKSIKDGVIRLSWQSMTMDQFMGNTISRDHTDQKLPFCTEIWAFAGDKDKMHKIWEYDNGKNS